jgi:methyl-accepting chemotaxis protein
MQTDTRAILVLIAAIPVVISAVLIALFGEELSTSLRNEIIGLLLVVGGLSAVVTWFLADSLPLFINPQQYDEAVDVQLATFLSRLENRRYTDTIDLSPQQAARFPTLARLNKSLNTLLADIQTVYEQILPLADTVAEKSNVILNATNEQIGTTSDQDASVMQTSSTVQEVRATVTETAERAAAVAEMAQTSVNVSKAGQQAVTDAIDGMNLIRRRVESIADNILVLSEHTQQIGEIIATVSALADQSKLLALNASVEAARAGEEGKGFAVVAMEVRNLAEQSRDATNQVRDLLSEIQQATNSAVMVTEEGTKGVDAGVGLVNRAGDSIRELSETIEEAAYAAVQIAASTRQQTVGMDQLATAMNNIRQATASTTSSTMSVERAARELNTISRNLSELVEPFRETRNGATP